MEQSETPKTMDDHRSQMDYIDYLFHQKNTQLEQVLSEEVLFETNKRGKHDYEKTQSTAYGHEKEISERESEDKGKYFQHQKTYAAIMSLVYGLAA